MSNLRPTSLSSAIAAALTRPRVAAIALAAATLAPAVYGQTPRYIQRTLPSLSPVKVAYISAPALADLDGDSDVDAILGDGGGRLRYFRRDRLGFSQRVEDSNPFDGLSFGGLASPAVGDLDADGDLDVVVGDGTGVLAYLRNSGGPRAPAFEQLTGAANPLDAIDVGTRATPFLADVDGDDDLDLVAGAADGELRYFENTGSPAAPVFENRIGPANPFDGIAAGDGDAAPALADLDDDGDLDLVVGGLFGRFDVYRNEGSAQSPSFQLDEEAPLSDVNLGLFSKVSFADVDRDGDLDAVTGEEYGEVIWYRNIQTAEEPVFVPIRDSQSPFFGIDVGYDSAFATADLDGDGDLDAAVGNRFGHVDLLRNEGSRFSPVYTRVPGGRIVNGGTRYFTSPAFVELDGDASPELVVGDDTGRLRYFRRSGGPFEYVEETGDSNPFSALLFTQNINVSFGDLDGDGDLDAAGGSFEGTLVYLENVAAMGAAPQFEVRTGGDNPFDGINVGQNSAPTLVDLDKDGDLDLALGGETLNTLFYAENTGTPQAPVFIERGGASNPFVLNPVGTGAAPLATELNGDDVSDFLVGRGEPGVIYLIEDLIFADGFEEPPP